MKKKILLIAFSCAFFCVALGQAQVSTAPSILRLPDAPRVHEAALASSLLEPSPGMPQQALTPAASGTTTQPNEPAKTGMPQQPAAMPAPRGQPQLPRLTLQDAEAMALKNHPRITIAQLNALASLQVVREVRSGLLPTITSNTTAVGVYQDGNRITAGVLNNPSVFQRAATGLTGSQLITDFGRSTSLTSSSRLHARAQQETALATREQIVYLVDQAFYNALSAQVLVQVADSTVSARQVLVDQVQALEQAKLRSALDLSFAQVSLAQAQLLLVNAKNNRDSAYAALSEALGLPDQKLFVLEDTLNAQNPAGDVENYIQTALQTRPDVKALEFEESSAQKFTTAEKRLQLPTVSALGAAGITPVRSDRLGNNGYGAVGVNMQIPVFNGFLFSARANEAELRARAAAERVRDFKDTVARQVRSAWLDANSAFERQQVAAKLLDQANLSLDLAQARYKLGLSSIVELSQAQLQQTEAQISTVTAKYQYEVSLAVLAYQTGAISH
ncbi:MAG TPA: TolC family protein [Candidatus Limnocylindrales bacterium]|jgi:outer membrane protein|nr:TolC family protein [Candidatus Limnocylindrales bacterium]